MKKLTIINYPDGDKVGNDLLKDMLRKYNPYVYQEFTGGQYGKFVDIVKSDEIRPRMKILVFKKLTTQDVFDLISLMDMNKIPVTLSGGSKSFIAPDFILTTHEFHKDGGLRHFKGSIRDIDITYIDITKLKLK